MLPALPNYQIKMQLYIFFLKLPFQNTFKNMK